MLSPLCSLPFGKPVDFPSSASITIPVQLNFTNQPLTTVAFLHTPFLLCYTSRYDFLGSLHFWPISPVQTVGRVFLSLLGLNCQYQFLIVPVACVTPDCCGCDGLASPHFFVHCQRRSVASFWSRSLSSSSFYLLFSVVVCLLHSSSPRGL